MAQEVQTFACTIPAGTAKATPTEILMSLPLRIVNSVQFRVPPGPQGLVGFALAVAHQPIIPYGNGQWIIANDELTTWDLRDYPQSGAWSLFGYNTGIYDHTIQVRFLLNLPPLPTPPTPTPIPAAQLSGVAP